MNKFDPITRLDLTSSRNGLTNGDSSVSFPDEDVLPITERRLFARKMNGTSVQDIQELRHLLDPEYNTLARYKKTLLSNPDLTHHYFLINGEDLEVHSSLDSALERGYTQYSNDLFFVGAINEKQINAYLST